MPKMFNFKTKIFVFFSLLLVLSPVMAEDVRALYDVDVLVADENADTRWRVFKEGLDEVFIRIAGDSFVMDKLKRPPASRYIKQYSYEPVENPVVNDDDEFLAHRLKIQYNGSAIAKYLRDNGFPVWGEHRPDVVVWLAIRDGRNEYVLKKGDQSLLKSAADKALHRRGIPDRWPLYDAKDRKVLKVADIRGGFRDPVLTASKRYGRGPALAGSLIWNGKVWQSSWSLLMANANRHWSLVDADYKQLINKAIDQAADEMGAIFAIHGVGKDKQQVVVRLEVQAVNSIQKYRKLESYLRDLSAVAQLETLEVDGQNAIFKVTLRSNEEEFLSLLKNDGELIKTAPVKSLPGPEKNTAIKIEPLPLPSTTPTAVEKAVAVTPETGGISKQSLSGVLATEQVALRPGAPSGELVVELQVEPVIEREPQTPVYYYKLRH